MANRTRAYLDSIAVNPSMRDMHAEIDRDNAAAYDEAFWDEYDWPEPEPPDLNCWVCGGEGWQWCPACNPESKRLAEEN